jgi:hypothetical protein
MRRKILLVLLVILLPACSGLRPLAALQHVLNYKSSACTANTTRTYYDVTMITATRMRAPSHFDIVSVADVVTVNLENEDGPTQVAPTWQRCEQTNLVMHSITTSRGF